MIMTIENGRARSTGDREEEQGMSGNRAASEPTASLGGWRPVKFSAAAPQRPVPAPVVPSGRDPFSALLAAEISASDLEGAFPAFTPRPAGCKEGLAGLFSARPAARPLPVPPEGIAVQPRGIRVETDRLVLRVLRLDDFDDYFAVAADPETFRYSQRGAMTSDEAWTRLLRHVGHWAVMGWGLFAIEEKATGRFVGEAGLGDFRRGLGEDFDGVPEAGCTIARWAQGLGYATEAMEAALAWIDANLGAPRTVCLVNARNTASLRVAEKVGYERFGLRSYRGYDAVLFERRRQADTN